MHEYVKAQAVEPFVILRHDVDRRPKMALQMVKMERDMGTRATYYFRMMKEAYVLERPYITLREKIVKDHEMDMSGVFFKELDLTKADHNLGIGAKRRADGKDAYRELLNVFMLLSE